MLGCKVTESNKLSVGTKSNNCTCDNKQSSKCHTEITTRILLTSLISHNAYKQDKLKVELTVRNMFIYIYIYIYIYIIITMYYYLFVPVGDQLFMALQINLAIEE